jgi:hypothetical protein
LLRNDNNWAIHTLTPRGGYFLGLMTGQQSLMAQPTEEPSILNPYPFEGQ